MRARREQLRKILADLIEFESATAGRFPALEVWGLTSSLRPAGPHISRGRKEKRAKGERPGAGMKIGLSWAGSGLARAGWPLLFF